MWNTEIFFARKMKFLFDKKLFRWFDQPSNRCTYNHGRIHNFFVDVALFYQTWRSKRWKAGTSSSSPFLVKNVTFLFDKKYLHDSVQRFESFTRNHAFPVQDTTNTFLWLLPIFSVGKVRLSIPETASHEFQRRGEPSVLFRGRSPSEIQREYFTAVKSNSCSREQRTKSRRNGWPARMKSPI